MPAGPVPWVDQSPKTEMVVGSCQKEVVVTLFDYVVG